MPLPGTSEERLLQMPELRALPWREGVDPASENLVGGDSRRKQIKFGCLLATRGDIQKIPCTTCQNGRGKFSKCIALEGFFKGACASCQLSGGPNRCSIKQQDDEDGSPVGRPSERSRKSSSKSSKRPPSREGSQPKQVKKRRRTADGLEQDVEWDSSRPEWQQDTVDARAQPPNTSVVQSPWASSQLPPGAPTPLPPMSQHPHVNGAPAFRASMYQHPPSAVPPLERHGSSGSPRPPPERRISGGWAAVNKPTAPLPESRPPPHHSHYIPSQSQQPPLPPPHQLTSSQPPQQPVNAPPPPHPHHYPPPSHYSQQPSHHGLPSLPSNNHHQQPPPNPYAQPHHQSHQPPQPPQHYSPYGMHPPPQQPPPHQAPPPQLSALAPNSHTGTSNGANFPPVDPQSRDPKSNTASNGPYIDSVPQAKQRQLYGIVTGIQGGIKHLQSELDTLKRALGMEE